MPLTSPGVPLISRPRLLAKLQNATARKLTLISAPPGYGKSVLATQFAEQASRPVLWQPLEAQDRDLPTLVSHHLQVLNTAFPGSRAKDISSDTTPSEAAGKTVETLREIRSDLIYILDDVHQLYGAPRAEDWLRLLVTYLPHNCHLVLLSRTVPDLPLAELMARQEVTTIGTEDLRLTRDEIEVLATHVWKSNVQPNIIDNIDQVLEGWPVGVALSLLPPPDDFQRLQFQGHTGPEALFNTLAGAMLDRQPPPFKDFLLASSTLLYMNVDLVTRVLDLPSAREYLEEILSLNLFVRPRPGGVAFHSLFRNFLQQRFKATNYPGFLALHERAAHHFESENQIEASFIHYLSAEQYHAAHVLANHVAEALFVQGKLETLLSWKNALKQYGQSSANLLYCCAVVHTDRYEHDQAEKDLADACELLEQGFDAGLSARIEIQRGLNESRQGKALEARERLVRFLSRWIINDAIRAHALFVLGLAELQIGNTQAALEAFKSALPLYRLNMSALALSFVLQNIGVCYERLGNLREACAFLQESVALLRPLGFNHRLAQALNNLGYYFVLASNYAQADKIYHEGLSLVAVAPDRRTEAALLWNLGDLKRDLGYFNESQKLYRRALETLNQDDTWLRCYILVSLAVLNCWQQKWHEAASLATESIRIAKLGNFALQRSVAEAIFLVSESALDKVNDTLPLLELVLADIRQQEARIKLLAVLPMVLRIAVIASRKVLVNRLLEEILLLVKQTGVAQPAAAEIVNSRSLMTLFQNSGSSELLQRDIQVLLSHHSSTATQSSPIVSNIVSVRAYTLGTGRVFIDNRRILISEWQSAIARELFFYLLFEGPAHRSKIGAEFWPEFSSDQVRANFHTAIKRTRRALGENIISFSDEVNFLDKQASLWCDAREFETLISQARALAPRDARTEDLYDRAIRIYDGEFLPEMSHAWTMHYREKFQDLYIEALIGLAACMKSRRDLKNATRILKRALKLEPYREDIHHLVLNIYADRGMKRKILEHYGELTNLLRSDLNVDPSIETKALFSRLID